MRRSWLLVTGLMVGVPPAVHGQQLRMSPSSAAVRASLRPVHPVAQSALRLTPSAVPVPDSTLGPRRSRVGAAGLGFLAGAAAGVVVAYFVDQSRSSGEGRLENYLGIPLALGTVTFMTVFIAMGD